MKGGKLILVADDDPNDIFLLQRAFRDAAVENPWHAVRDGQEAIDYLSGAGQFADRTLFPLPALLILDLKMPRKSGMDVLQWLRGVPALRHLPTVVFSSSAHPSDVEMAYEHGANGFIVKPSGTKDRLTLIKNLTDFWLVYNQPPPVAREQP